MQKTLFKLGLLVTMTCLFLALGTFIAAGDAQARQSSRPHFGPKPHITVKILSDTTHLYNNKYMASAVIYGIGFNDCTCICTTDCGNTGVVPPNYNNTPSCSNPCNNSGNVPPNYNNTPNTTPCNHNNSCNNGSVPPNYNNTPNTTSCSNPCGDSGNVPPNYNNTPNTTPCSNPCDNSGNVPPNYNNTPNNNYNVPSNDTCSSYNNCATNNNDGCECNTVNLQSSNANLSAPGVNLSEVPVNTFGEFKVTVRVQVTPKQTQTAPSIWAVNSYDGQSSNPAPVSCCSTSFCCW